MLVLLSLSVESSNCYHLNKHSLKKTEKFFDAWCKNTGQDVQKQPVSSKHSFSLVIMTLEMRLISQEVSYFQVKKLSVKQVHGGAELFSCLFPVSFQAAVFTIREKCQLKQGLSHIFCSFLGTSTFYFSSFLSLIVKGK